MATLHQRFTQSPIISDRLLRVVACPVCKSSLISDTEASQLHCATCKVSFPVRDGIPTLLIKDAIPQR
jgi:hypothetical protein